MDNVNLTETSTLNSLKPNQSSFNELAGLDYKQYFNNVEEIIDNLCKFWKLNQQVKFPDRDPTHSIELLAKDDLKFEACKFILENLRTDLKHHQSIHKQTQLYIVDKIMINFVLRLFKIMNDSLTMMSEFDDVVHVSQLIIFLIAKISTQDFVERLDLFAKCRASLGNFQVVQEYLIRESFKLSLEFNKDSTRKLKAKQNFLNGCLAFAFVSIPAIANPLIRIDLLIEGAKLALDKTSLSLADYYLKQIMILLVDLTDSENSTKVDNQARSSSSKISQNYGSFALGHSSKSDDFKSLIEHVKTVTKLFSQYEYDIDLKHKLLLKSLVTDSFDQYPDLLESLASLNIE